jgi:L-asparagine transporter-like permease
MADKTTTRQKMGLNATWSMAVGGMVGGGIFSVLGVVILIAGRWAWLSFLLGGLIALATGYSYSQLSERFAESGGVYSYLRETKHKRLSGSLSWVLIFGYILTLSVYAFPFGHYLANAIGVGMWLPKLCALIIVGGLIWINLQGVKQASWLEIVIVWGKLLVLLVIAGFGLWRWQPEMLTQGIQDKSIVFSLVGAASVFMAYEGFQLLTYDYDAIQNPRKTLPRGILLAIVSVIAVYIAVCLGATMLVGAGTIVAEKEVAIAVAGQAAFGTTGLILATVAAIFSTSSAINSTIFATARLTRDIANNKELPGAFGHENRNGVPDLSVIIIGWRGGAGYGRLHREPGGGGQPGVSVHLRHRQRAGLAVRQAPSLGVCHRGAGGRGGGSVSGLGTATHLACIGGAAGSGVPYFHLPQAVSCACQVASYRQAQTQPPAMRIRLRRAGGVFCYPVRNTAGGVCSARLPGRASGVERLRQGCGEEWAGDWGLRRISRWTNSLLCQSCSRHNHHQDCRAWRPCPTKPTLNVWRTILEVLFHLS